jgi:hypothetical protein
MTTSVVQGEQELKDLSSVECISCEGEMSLVGRVCYDGLVIPKRETCLLRHLSWNKLSWCLLLVS